MTTKATRDVLDVKVRPITDGFKVQGNCGSDFAIDGVPIGLNTPCEAVFQDLLVTNFQVSGDINMNGNRIINAGQGTAPGDYVTLAQLNSATGNAQVGNDFIPAGTMVPWPNQTPPTGWVMCDGKTVGSDASPGTTDYRGDEFEDLFDVLKFMAPNTGLEDFATGDTVVLPDLTGRIPVGLDSTQLNVKNLNNVGATAGEGEVQLDVSELPSHGHVGTTTSTSAASGTTTGTGAHEHNSHAASWCAQGSGDNNLQGCGSSSTWGGGHHSHGFDLPAHSHDINVTDTGGDIAHNNVQPSIAMVWIMKAIPGVIDQDIILADGSVPMDPGSFLNFSSGGEPVGLPATPGGLSSATSKLYVDNEITAAISAFSSTADATYLKLTGGALSGNLDINNNRIANVPTIPANPTDAVNSLYVLDEVKNGVNGAVTHLGAASVLIASGPAQLVPGPHTFSDPVLANPANNAVQAIIYVKVWDTTAPPSTQISLVFEPGIFPTEMWVPRMDGVNLPTGDILAQQFFVPIPTGGPLTWDVSATGLDGEIWLVGFVKSIP